MILHPSPAPQFFGEKMFTSVLSAAFYHLSRTFSGYSRGVKESRLNGLSSGMADGFREYLRMGGRTTSLELLSSEVARAHSWSRNPQKISWRSVYSSRY